jgi:thymidylate synthase
MKNGLDEQYIDLLKDILENGVEKNTRNGKVLSVFGRSIRYKFKDGKFPLLTTKKMAFKTIVTELLWFLRGDTNIKFLVDNGCNVWNGDAYKNYCKIAGRYEEPDYNIHVDDPNENRIRLMTQIEFIEKIKSDDEFSKKWGELGKIYGFQWRNWGKDFKQIPNETGDGVYDITTTGIDQITNLINDLKTNADSRRLMVNAWNPGELEQMILPPCHYGFQVYTRELTLKERFALAGNKYPPGGLPNQAIYYMNQRGIPTRAISLSWNQRSCDFPLGIPYNIASYGILLTMLAKQVNMVPDELIGNLGDCHIYKNQIDGVNEQLNRESYELPTLKLSDKVVDDISEYTLDDIILENYKSQPKIHFPLSN